MLATLPDFQPRLTDADTDEQVLALWVSQKSPVTQKNYFSTVQAFRQFLVEVTGKTNLSTVTYDDLVLWVDSLKDLNPNTQRTKIATIKSLFSFAHDLGYLRFNAAKLLKQPKKQDTLTERILSKDQVKSMVAGAGTVRNRLIIKTFYLLGLRVSELVAMTWKDFVQTNHGVKLKVLGKGQKLRYIAVPANLYSELVEHLRDDDSGFVFRSRQSRSRNGEKTQQLSVRMVQKLIQSSAGDIKVSPHFLRHSFASHSLDNGCPIQVVSRDLGHSDIKTTSQYIHVNDSHNASQYLLI